MSFGAVECFIVVMLFLFLGEAIAARTKAFIPSVFVSAVLFLIGFWTFIPKDVVSSASFSPSFVQVCMALLLVHLGTLMDLRKLIQQWKAVTIALAGVVGTIIMTMTIGLLIFDWHTIVAATPPLSGGIVAALLMSQGLKAQGIDALIVLPIAMFIMHSFFGYPITSWCLKREGKRLIKGFRTKESQLSSQTKEEVSTTISATKKFIPTLPEKYRTSSIIMLKLGLIGYVSMWLSKLTAGTVNQYIICLILGVIFCELGFLESNALNKAGVFNWLIYGLLAYIFSQLSAVKPDQLLTIIIPIISLIILGIIGMFIMSMLLAKPLGYSRPMAFACALTALFGFPADYIITTEICNHVGKTDEERTYLTENLLPKMLVGGFATVSIASVVITTIFLKLL
ncbi:hypothetical protein [Terrilactibacillus laevilacticus]|uniref:hypothetical protein n=1 Tax=Terrilactibacillus laevilacticus TaxID=1380157 RepID=UPI001146A1B3|nr:hypothetical protein [Terrilactibacillus laevilacticus]